MKSWLALQGQGHALPCQWTTGLVSLQNNRLAEDRLTHLCNFTWDQEDFNPTRTDKEMSDLLQGSGPPLHLCMVGEQRKKNMRWQAGVYFCNLKGQSSLDQWFSAFFRASLHNFLNLAVSLVKNHHCMAPAYLSGSKLGCRWNCPMYFYFGEEGNRTMTRKGSGTGKFSCLF